MFITVYRRAFDLAVRQSGGVRGINMRVTLEKAMRVTLEKATLERAINMSRTMRHELGRLGFPRGVW